MPAAAGDADLALVGGKVYPSPTSQPIDDAVVLVQAGKIVAVGKRAEVGVPKSAQVVNCWGKVIVAGFWNSHVHFETGWEDAAHASAETPRLPPLREGFAPLPFACDFAAAFPQSRSSAILAARSVLSHENSLRPKWPYDAVRL